MAQCASLIAPYALISTRGLSAPLPADIHATFACRRRTTLGPPMALANTQSPMPGRCSWISPAASRIVRPNCFDKLIASVDV